MCFSLFVGWLFGLFVRSLFCELTKEREFLRCSLLFLRLSSFFLRQTSFPSTWHLKRLLAVQSWHWEASSDPSSQSLVPSHCHLAAACLCQSSSSLVPHCHLCRRFAFWLRCCTNRIKHRWCQTSWQAAGEWRFKLCGSQIPHDRALHSIADVLTHISITSIPIP